MKAFVLNQTGGIENLKPTDIDVPTPAENEVLIEVKALSLNPVDFKVRGMEPVLSMIYGEERPAIIGWDIAGVVKAKGANANQFEVGDKVFGMINFPGAGKAYAEMVTAPQDHLAKIPDNISFEEAAACTLAPLTALQVMSPHVKKGDKVLIQAGSGGVGHYAIQIAKHLGAHVTTTCSAKNRAFVLSLGADEHIDYKSQNYEDILSDMDFAFEMIDENTIAKSINVMRDGGKIISIAVHQFNDELQAAANSKNVSLTNYLVQSNGKDMNTLREMLAAGTLKSHVSEVIPFNDLGRGHVQLESGRTVGKLVVKL